MTHTPTTLELPFDVLPRTRGPARGEDYHANWHILRMQLSLLGFTFSGYLKAQQLEKQLTAVPDFRHGTNTLVQGDFVVYVEPMVRGNPVTVSGVTVRVVDLVAGLTHLHHTCTQATDVIPFLRSVELITPEE